MSFSLPTGWKQGSEKLFVHDSNVRIQRMMFRSQEVWLLIPRGAEDPVLQFPPTSEGRDMAFAAFVTGAFGHGAGFEQGSARTIGQG